MIKSAMFIVGDGISSRRRTMVFVPSIISVALLLSSFLLLILFFCNIDGVIGQTNQGLCTPGDSNYCGQNSVARVAEMNNNRALGDFSTIGGGEFNVAGGSDIDAEYITIGGGYSNGAYATGATISGGKENALFFDAEYSVISGGRNNRILNNVGGVITGGENNEMGERGNYTTISGGKSNIAEANHATVTGGEDNRASGKGSVVLGGKSNTASGDYSAIPGGKNNVAAGMNSIAMGTHATASGDSSMVINLVGMRANGGTNEVEADQPGQFVAAAKQFRFQISNDPGENDENVVRIDEDNIQNLIDAIARQPGR